MTIKHAHECGIAFLGSSHRYWRVGDYDCVGFEIHSQLKISVGDLYVLKEIRMQELAMMGMLIDRCRRLVTPAIFYHSNTSLVTAFYSFYFHLVGDTSRVGAAISGLQRCCLNALVDKSTGYTGIGNAAN